MNYIAASIFTTCIDPQRDVKWNPTARDLQDWHASVKALCVEGSNIYPVIFYDQLPLEVLSAFAGDCVTFIQVEDCNYLSPHDYRWIVYKNFVDSNLEEGDIIFFTDITDVVVANDPFPHIQPSVLYSGDEETPWDNGWANARSRFHRKTIEDFEQVYQANKNANLLNCGILGGTLDVVNQFLEKAYHYIELTLEKPYDTTDMVTHNYVIRKYFPNVIHGAPLNSIFKNYEYSRKDVWFIHK